MLLTHGGDLCSPLVVISGSLQRLGGGVAARSCTGGRPKRFELASKDCDLFPGNRNNDICVGPCRDYIEGAGNNKQSSRLWTQPVHLLQRVYLLLLLVHQFVLFVDVELLLPAHASPVYQILSNYAHILSLCQDMHTRFAIRII